MGGFWGYLKNPDFGVKKGVEKGVKKGVQKRSKNPPFWDPQKWEIAQPD